MQYEYTAMTGAYHAKNRSEYRRETLGMAKKSARDHPPVRITITRCRRPEPAAERNQVTCILSSAYVKHTLRNMNSRHQISVERQMPIDSKDMKVVNKRSHWWSSKGRGNAPLPMICPLRTHP